jgi:pantoate--beta-alanine ligase
MKIVHTIKDLDNTLEPFRTKVFSIGFVPTMGALHEGHLSLVRKCVKDNSICVTSIFVNPTQFNDKTDLETYPRTPERDYEMLEAAGCHYVFAPSTEEMYPVPDERSFCFGTVGEVMEGARRPGHFNGVAQVVSKLFEIVKPHRAYFGEKDFQQVAVVREMTAQLKLPVQIIACPIVREPDGLAMSSRNMRLTPEERRVAPKIAAALKESNVLRSVMTVSETVDYVLAELDAEPLFKTEYFEIVDGHTLLPLKDWSASTSKVGCIAVRCGAVRLIDNVIYY